MPRLIRSCAWCDAVHLAGRWHPVRTALQMLGVEQREQLGPVTHDICERCAARF
jgi:hypothetical protein